jgi:peroxin-14
MDSPRESAIQTAISFLRNPKVARSSLLQKRNFLASKGLSDDEIQLAFERVGIFTKINMMDTPVEESTVINVPSQAQPPATYKHQMTTFEKIKDLISSAALISGIAYAVYMFYKRYIEPFLFGRKKKGDKMDELTKTTKAINGELIRVREELNNSKQAQESANKVVQNSLQSFKTEIETIKGILLNHRNFSSKPSMSSAAMNIPKIPSWQLASKSKNCDDKNDDDKHSNSSENDTEVITEEPQKSSNRSPANSDSSLEIM